jgi:hypothetical protein
MKWIFLVALVFLVACQTPVGCQEDAKVCDDGTVVVRQGPDCTFADCPEVTEVLCTPEQRIIDSCPENHRPVCGWSDPEQIQCFTYPCAQTYTNSCFACQDSTVKSWTVGECPSPR